MHVPFARKYRPKRFKEVVGQEIPKKILLNAVKMGKISSAYLFAGPRGSGKTTLARILTKAINCLNLQDGEPCGECENCVSLDKGNFPDLIEIDAASNRGIEDIRSIRDAVSYTPIKGKHKVYILDEAHMLTKEAFNALLKTLEEPPPRTVFILCTTEYDKILPTILSRCQRLIFSKHSDAEIVYNLMRICESESINCEEQALKALAAASDGAMRDAVSLLDQAATYGEGKVSSDVVEEFLGLPSQERVRDFIRLLLHSQVDEALEVIDGLAHRGFNLFRFWNMVEDEVRNLLLYRSLKNPDRVIRVEDFHREFANVALSKLLYMEKIINSAKEYSRTRGLQRAIEIAVVKSIVLKDIISLSEMMNYLFGRERNEEKEIQSKSKEGASPELSSTQTAKGGSYSEEQEGAQQLQEKPQEDLKSQFLRTAKLKPLALKVLERAPYRVEEDKLIFSVSSENAKLIECDKLKTQFPYVDFEISDPPRKSTDSPDLVNKISDLFEAKIIKHEKRKKK